MRKIYLTGIKPTGDVHLGNYLGAIKPAVSLSSSSDGLHLYFVADYHALNSMSAENRKNIKQYTLNILATYVACGLNPDKVSLYRQSDIPEIFELQTILNNFAPKSILNSAHAYKSSTQKNIELDRDLDEGINLGLYNYPMLMSADILIFNANYIPVGKDQIQHIEIAREVARRFNHNVNKEMFNLPETITQKDLEVIGSDGRKMSKSYNNTIKLFSTEKELKKSIMAIVTDNSDKDAPKPLDNNIRKLYKHFANEKELECLDSLLLKGIPYGEAKEILFVKINNEIKDKRELYFNLLSNPKDLENILLEGAEKVKPFAKKGLTSVKKILGL